MLVEADRSHAPSAVRTELTAIFISLELSQSKWLITSLAPGNGEKMSKFRRGPPSHQSRAQGPDK